ncbi:MAG: UDP-N-acetylglucosamine 1-carboxyvinyltransferase [Planctomycetota bacterium]|nr:UDP-N-acetylglucosamine 1-carboxyvinyltransferase [Planctomycetota bacterium]
MEKLIIEGGLPLEGTVHTAGAKNATLPILAAALLTHEPLSIPNAPRLRDVNTMVSLLRLLGCEIESAPDGALVIQAAGDISPVAEWEQVRQMRGSVCVLGPLLARNGRARVSLPGGCAFGVRPIDLHLKGMEALGAEVRVEHGYVHATAPEGGLQGAEMFLASGSGPTVLGTANVMMAATLARGRTVIHGAACEPEVSDLADCLNAMGASISGQGSPRLEIEGVDELHGATHRVIPDRIEAGTYLVAGALTGGRVRVADCRPDHLFALLDHMARARIPLEIGPDWVETNPRTGTRDSGASRYSGVPRATDVTTHAYPGFPTDLQAQWMTLMCLADGISLIEEQIYPDRYMHVAELARLGARLRRVGTRTIVQGLGATGTASGGALSGAPVTASDLRASAALVLAGLVATGTTEVHRVYHIDRGYEPIEDRLNALGANIRRVPE